MSSDLEIIQTMSTPGWAKIKEKALDRIKQAEYRALAERRPEEFAKLHAQAWAAFDALQEFIQELEAEQGA